MLNGEADEKSMADSPERDEETEVLAKILNAAMTGDGARLRELLDQHPNFREELEGLDADYAEFQTAMQSDPAWYGKEYAAIRRELDDLVAKGEALRIGSLTKLTRDWPGPEVVQLYQAFAASMVSTIAREAGHEMRPDEILTDAEYLCSPPSMKRIREASKARKHVRDEVIEILVMRWKDPKLQQRVTLDKLEAALMRNKVFRKHLAAWEDRMLQPVEGCRDQ